MQSDEAHYREIFSDQKASTLLSPRGKIGVLKKKRLENDLNFDQYDVDLMGELNAYQLQKYIYDSSNKTLSIEQIKQFLSELVLTKTNKVNKFEFSAFKQSFNDKKEELLKEENNLAAIEFYDQLPYKIQTIPITKTKKNFQQDLGKDNYWTNDLYDNNMLSFLFDDFFVYVPSSTLQYSNVLGNQYYQSQRCEDLKILGTIKPQSEQSNGRSPRPQMSQHLMVSPPMLSELYFPDVSPQLLQKELYFVPSVFKQSSDRLQTFVIAFNGTTFESDQFSEDLYFSLGIYNLRTFAKVSSDYYSATSYRVDSLDFSVASNNNLFAVQLNPQEDYVILVRIFRRYSTDLMLVRDYYSKGKDEVKDFKLKSKTPRTANRQFVMNGVMVVGDSLRNLNKKCTFYGLKLYRDEGSPAISVVQEVISGKARECSGIWSIKIEALKDYKSDFLVIEKAGIKQTLEQQPKEANEKKRLKIPLLSCWEWTNDICKEFINEMICRVEDIVLGKELKKSVLRIDYYWRINDSDISKLEQSKVFIQNLELKDSYQTPIYGKGLGFFDEVVINLPFPLTNQQHLLIVVTELNSETLEVVHEYYSIFSLLQNSIITGDGLRTLYLTKGKIVQGYLTKLADPTKEENCPYVQIDIRINSSVYPSSTEIHQFLKGEITLLKNYTRNEIIKYLPLIITRYINLASEKNYADFSQLFEILDNVFGNEMYSDSLVDAIENYPIINRREETLEKQTFVILFRALLNLTNQNNDCSKRFLRHSWVLFVLCEKSIIAFEQKIREEGEEEIENIICDNCEEMKRIRKQLIVSIQKYSSLIRGLILNEETEEVRQGNCALAQFLMRLTPIWNRGDVGKMIENHLDVLSKSMDENKMKTLEKDGIVMKYLGMVRIEFCETMMLMEEFYEINGENEYQTIAEFEDEAERKGFVVMKVIRVIYSSMMRSRDEGKMALNSLVLILNMIETNNKWKKELKEKVFGVFLPFVITIIEEWENISKWRVNGVNNIEDISDIKKMYFCFMMIIGGISKEVLKKWINCEIGKRIEIILEHLRRCVLLFSYFPDETRQNPIKENIKIGREIIAFMSSKKIIGNEKFNEDIKIDMTESICLGGISATPRDGTKKDYRNSVNNKSELSNSLTSPRSFRLSKKFERTSDSEKNTPKKRGIIPSLKMSSVENIGLMRKSLTPSELKLKENSPRNKIIIEAKEEGVIERGRVLVAEMSKVVMKLIEILIERIKEEEKGWKESVWKIISKTMFEVPWIEYYSEELINFIRRILEKMREIEFKNTRKLLNEIMKSIVELIYNDNLNKRKEGIRIMYLFARDEYINKGEIKEMMNEFIKALCENHYEKIEKINFQSDVFESIFEQKFEERKKEIKEIEEKYERDASKMKECEWREIEWGKKEGRIVDTLLFQRRMIKATNEAIEMMRIKERTEENEGLLKDCIEKIKGMEIIVEEMEDEAEMVKKLKKENQELDKSNRKGIEEIELDITEGQSKRKERSERNEQRKQWIEKIINQIIMDLDSEQTKKEVEMAYLERKKEIERNFEGETHLENMKKLSEMNESLKDMKIEEIEKMKEIEGMELNCQEEEKRTEKKNKEWEEFLSKKFENWGSEIQDGPMEVGYLKMKKDELESQIKQAKKCEKRVKERINYKEIEQKKEEILKEKIERSEEIVKLIEEFNSNIKEKEQENKKEEWNLNKKEEIKYYIAVINVWEEMSAEFGLMKHCEGIENIKDLIERVKNMKEDIENKKTKMKELLEEIKTTIGQKRIEKKADLKEIIEKGDEINKRGTIGIDIIYERVQIIIKKQEKEKKERKDYVALVKKLINSDEIDDIWQIFKGIREKEKENKRVGGEVRKFESCIGKMMKIDIKKTKSIIGKRSGISKCMSMLEIKDNRKERDKIVDEKGLFKEEVIIDVSVGMQKAFIEKIQEFRKEVDKVLRKLLTLKENESNCDAISEKYYQLSQEYYLNPQLHLTWMKRLIEHQKKHGNFVETAMGELHCVMYLIPLIDIRFDIKDLIMVYKCNQPPKLGFVDETEKEVFEHIDKAQLALQRANWFKEAIVVGKCVAKYYEDKNDYKNIGKYHDKLSNLYGVLLDADKEEHYYKVQCDDKEYIYTSGGKKEIFKKLLNKGDDEIEELVKVNGNTFELKRWTKHHIVIEKYQTEIVLPNIIRRSLIKNKSIKKISLVNHAEEKIQKMTEEINRCLNVEIRINKCKEVLNEMNGIIGQLEEKKCVINHKIKKALISIQNLIRQIILDYYEKEIFVEKVFAELNIKYLELRKSIKQLIKK